MLNSDTLTLSVMGTLANNEDPDEMRTLANSEDPDKLPQYAAFHQSALFVKF